MNDRIHTSNSGEPSASDLGRREMNSARRINLILAGLIAFLIVVVEIQTLNFHYTHKTRTVAARALRKGGHHWLGLTGASAFAADPNEKFPNYPLVKEPILRPMAGHEETRVEDLRTSSSETRTWRGPGAVDRLQHTADQTLEEERQGGGEGASASGEAGKVVFAPKFDLEDQHDQFVAHVDVPGVRQSDLKVQVEGRDLIVSGSRERVTERREDQGRSVVRERWSGIFKRTIRLPEAVRADRVQTSYQNGLLTITLPKAELRGLPPVPPVVEGR